MHIPVHTGEKKNAPIIQKEKVPLKRKTGFRFSEDINLISLLKENSSLAFDLPEPQQEKVRVLRELVQEYYTSLDLSKHITLDSPEMVLKSMYPIMKV